MLKRRPEYIAACPDCPGSRLGCLDSVVGKTKDACHFSTATVGARAPLPVWEGYDLAWVRRGVIIRERPALDGRATAIDAAGPGCMFPLDDDCTGYAAADAIVCLLRRPSLEEAIDRGQGLQVLELHRATLLRVERLSHARGAPSLREKVCRLLVVLAESLSPPRIREDLPDGLQQRDLARLLGVRHESVCRVVGELEREGRLTRGPTGSMAKLDLALLREV